MKKTMLIIGLAFAAITQSYARLGWTYDQCVTQWGQPWGHYSNNGAWEYGFTCGPNLQVMVTFLNSTVASIDYGSKDKNYLKSITQTLMQANFVGAWTKYDDGKGKDTWNTWNVINSYGDVVAYAIFHNSPDVNNWYHFQVSGISWDSYLRQHNGSATSTSSGNGLNI
jgi:hypothetical protein